MQVKMMRKIHTHARTYTHTPQLHLHQVRSICTTDGRFLTFDNVDGNNDDGDDDVY